MVPMPPFLSCVLLAHADPGVGPLEAILSHHREPDGETSQFMGPELLEQFSDNTLPVDAYRSRR